MMAECRYAATPNLYATSPAIKTLTSCFFSSVMLPSLLSSSLGYQTLWLPTWSISLDAKHHSAPQSCVPLEAKRLFEEGPSTVWVDIQQVHQACGERQAGRRSSHPPVDVFARDLWSVSSSCCKFAVLLQPALRFWARTTHATYPRYSMSKPCTPSSSNWSSKSLGARGLAP